MGTHCVRQVSGRLTNTTAGLFTARLSDLNLNSPILAMGRGPEDGIQETPTSSNNGTPVTPLGSLKSLELPTNGLADVTPNSSEDSSTTVWHNRREEEYARQNLQIPPSREMVPARRRSSIAGYEQAMQCGTLKTQGQQQQVLPPQLRLSTTSNIPFWDP